MLFIQMAFEDPRFYFSWIFTVVISIILHELAHGWAALWQGDHTPRIERRLTMDPMVHMGTYSLITLFLLGIAWGQMPINPDRFRSRYGEAYVAAAGPAMNVLLALVMLTAMCVMKVHDLYPLTDFGRNLQLFMLVFGVANMALAIFNLVPIPPLDGSKILENLNDSYARLTNDPDKAGMFGIMFLLLFVFFGSAIFILARQLVDAYITWLTGLLV